MNHFKAVACGLGCFVAQPPTPVKIIKEEIVINISVKHSERQNKPHFNQNTLPAQLESQWATTPPSCAASGNALDLEFQSRATDLQHCKWIRVCNSSVAMATCVKPASALQSHATRHSTTVCTDVFVNRTHTYILKYS